MIVPLFSLSKIRRPSIKSSRHPGFTVLVICATWEKLFECKFFDCHFFLFGVSECGDHLSIAVVTHREVYWFANVFCPFQRRALLNSAPYRFSFCPYCLQVVLATFTLLALIRYVVVCVTLTFKLIKCVFHRFPEVRSVIFSVFVN